MIFILHENGCQTLYTPYYLYETDRENNCGLRPDRVIDKLILDKMLLGLRIQLN